ncbi:MAG: hypothetical protein DRP12_00460 [Candidatus Aenigmatarchaeota archaeon]|nr:MAG: hypothetical protein DRP12_00460 [Candidatus Aenigmarchaeota archaeon]
MKKYLVLAILLLGGLAFIYSSFSGYFIYQPRELRIEVNRIVPITCYLKIDGTNWPLKAEVIGNGTAFNVTSLIINPVEYGLKPGNHTLQIIDLRTGQVYWKARLELAKDWTLLEPE